MGGDGFQTQKMKSWVSGQVKFWLMRLQNTAVEFLLRNECVDTEGFQSKHEQAKNAKNGHPRVGGGGRLEASGSARRDQEVECAS